MLQSAAASSKTQLCTGISGQAYEAEALYNNKLHDDDDNDDDVIERWLSGCCTVTKKREAHTGTPGATESSINPSSGMRQDALALARYEKVRAVVRVYGCVVL